MHREPNPKAQAAILRQVFAENGVNMVHRQALDVIARLNGHADWHVMSKASAPAIVVPPKVSFAGTPLPVRKIRAVEAGPLKCYQIEGIAYVADRATLEALDDISSSCSSALWASVEKAAQELGFTCVGSISVAEDDEQGDEDIKVFVGVELYGRCKLRENDSAPYELVEILDRLSAPRCTDAEGNVLAEASDWEVLSIDSHLDTVPNVRKSYVFEAAGVVATRAELDELPYAPHAAPKIWEEVKTLAETFGFDAVGNIDICEDDAEGDLNIQVYVCIRLQGRSYLTTCSPIPSALMQMLTQLTEPYYRRPTGYVAVALQPWELSVIESRQDPLMML